MLKLRRAKDADIVPINRIYNRATVKTLATLDTVPRGLEYRRKWLREHGRKYPVLVAELDGRTVGYAALNKWSHKLGYAYTVELSLYIDEKFQGRGIGRKLLAAILKEGKKAGFHVIASRIVKGSDISVHLHDELGFEKVGVMRQAGRKFGKWLDSLIYQKIV